MADTNVSEVWQLVVVALAARSLAHSVGSKVNEKRSRLAMLMNGSRKGSMVEVFQTRQEDYPCRRLTLAGGSAR